VDIEEYLINETLQIEEFTADHYAKAHANRDGELNEKR
jgi:hypothetical protein